VNCISTLTSLTSVEFIIQPFHGKQLSFAHSFIIYILIHSFYTIELYLLLNQLKMPSFSKLAALAGLASLSFASPVEKIQKRGANVHINQVQVGSVPKVGAAALQKAFVKFGKPVPTTVAAAAESGTVGANPEQYDAEYLCPVTVGSTTLNLDFDTGSADL
jgi:hypothetical protein